MIQNFETDAVRVASPAPITRAQLRLFSATSGVPTTMHELIQTLSAALNYLQGASRQLRHENFPVRAIDAVQKSEALVKQAADIILGTRALVGKDEISGQSDRLEDIVISVRDQLEAENRPHVDPGPII